MQPASMTPAERRSRSKLKPLISRGEMLHATLSLRRQVCGRPGCKCLRGEKHLTLILSRRLGGKVEQLYVPKPMEAEVREWLDRYRTVHELLETISVAQWERLKKMKTAR